MPALQPIAIAFSDRSLTLVQLARAGNGFRLHASVNRILPEGLVVSGRVQDPQLLAEEIRAALASGTPASFSGTRAFLALPERRTFLRSVTLSVQSIQEIAERLPWALDEHIPLPAEQASYDWSLASFKPSSATVQLAATPADAAASAASLLQLAGLSPEVFEPEAACFVRAVSPPHIGKREDHVSVLYVHIDAERAVFALYLPPAIAFTSSVELPRQAMVRALMQDQSISEEQAILLLRDGVGPTDTEERILRTLQPFLDRLADEAAHVLAYAETHAAPSTSTHTVSRMVLSGSLANLAGFAPYLALKTGHAVELADVLQALRLSLPKQQPQGAGFARVMAISLGLAAHPMRSDASPLTTNILPKPLREELSFRRVRRTTVTACIAIALGTILFSGYLSGLRMYLEMSVATAQATTTPDASLTDTEKLVSRANALAGTTTHIQDNRTVWTPFLLAFSPMVPPEIELFSLTLSTAPDGVHLAGFASTRSAYLKFLEALEQSHLFTQISSPASNLTFAENLTFTLSATIDLKQLTSAAPAL